jgi:hypothetical protein
MKLRILCLVLMASMTGLSMAGQAHDKNWPCSALEPTDFAGGARVVVVSASQDHFGTKYYCTSATSSPALPRTFPNDTQVHIVVIDMNPLTQTCSVSFNDTPTEEPSPSALAGLISVPFPTGTSQGSSQKAQANGGSGNNPFASLAGELFILPENNKGATNAKPSPRPTPEEMCKSAFNDEVKNVQKILAAVNSFDGLVNTEVSSAQGRVQEYNALVDRANALVGPAEQVTADKLAGLESDAISLSEIPAATPVLSEVPDELTDLPGPVDDLTGQDYRTAATNLAADAQEEFRNLTPGQACAKDDDIQKLLKKSDKFLQSVYSDVGGKAPYETTWKNQLDFISQASATLSKAKGQLVDALSKTGPTTARTDVDVIHQSTDRVTVSCTTTPLNISRIQLPDSAGTDQGKPQAAQSGAGQSAKGSSSGSSGTGASSGSHDGSGGQKSSTTTTTMSFNLSFGYGPRIFQSAGVVFSPLEQHSFTTAAVSSSPKCPAKMPDGTSAAVGCIVDDGNSNWRILPMYVASFRLWETLPNWIEWPYLSIGATVKSSSSNGTSLEYLPGLSLPLAHRRVFLTAGGYAGQVTHLSGGLVTGAQAVAPPTTLPTNSGYNWGWGFAVTFNINQKGASSTGSGQSSTGSSSTGSQQGGQSGKKKTGGSAPTPAS